MNDLAKIKEEFISYLNIKSKKTIDIYHLPLKVLEDIIREISGHSFNGQSVFQLEDEHYIYCYIYQEWKQRFQLLLSTFGEGRGAITSIGQVELRQVHSHRTQFENLFSEVDSLGIFQEVDYPI